MYLHQMKIAGFRGIENLVITFQKGLNIIIGENNSGKTSIIDALRICLGLGYQRGEIRVGSEDFFVDRYGKKSDSIRFDLVFIPGSKDEEGVFVEMLAVGKDNKLELQLHVIFTREEKEGEERIRRKYWGGENEGQSLPEELLDLLYFVYLDALRNSDRDLLPRSGNRLGQLFLKLVGDVGKQKDYARKLNDIVETDPDWKRLRITAKDKINQHLSQTTIVREPQEIDIDFVSLEYKKIVEQLQLFLPFAGAIERDKLQVKLLEDGIKDEGWRKYFSNPDENDLTVKDEFIGLLASTNPNNGIEKIIAGIFKESLTKFEVSQNGLGYNNLIFIATVLGDIIERKGTQSESYVALLMEEPEAHLHPQLQDTLFNYFGRLKEKNIQVFITSHSPTITAKTNIESLIVMEKETNRRLKATAMGDVPLAKEDRMKLERFLDVTKCQLFFATGVILVEGISEALVLPVFARMMGDKYDLEKNGIEVVNIGGVSFAPFARLFNSAEIDKRLNIRCVIVTDDDRGKGKGVGEEEASSRAKKAKELEGGNLKVELANHTFEHELFDKNKDVMKAVYGKMHSKVKIETASALVEKLTANSEKAEFAQVLAEHLMENEKDYEKFVVPDYLKRAIAWVVDGDSKNTNM